METLVAVCYGPGWSALCRSPLCCSRVVKHFANRRILPWRDRPQFQMLWFFLFPRPNLNVAALQDMLECTEELGDIISRADVNVALVVYLRANAAEKVKTSLHLGVLDKIVEYLSKVCPGSPSAIIQNRHPLVRDHWFGVSGLSSGRRGPASTRFGYTTVFVSRWTMIDVWTQFYLFKYTRA